MSNDRRASPVPPASEARCPAGQRHLDRPRVVVLATGNPGKQGELRGLLEALGWSPRPASAWGLDEPEETACDYVGNARLKAAYASAALGLPALGDDTGLEIPSAPEILGVHTKRWIDAQGGRKLAFETLRQRFAIDRGDAPPVAARLVCALAWAEPDGDLLTGLGIVEGHLRWPPSELPGPAAIIAADEGLSTDGVLLHRRRAFASLLSARSARGTRDG